MKGLLLILFLIPVIAAGQVRSKALADSINAMSGDFRKASGLINRFPGARVENITAADSDQYVTLVVRVRTGETTVAPLVMSASLVKVKLRSIVAGELTYVPLPYLPFYAEKDTIFQQPLSAFKTLAIAGSAPMALSLVDPPSLPYISEDISTLALIGAVAVKTAAIVPDSIGEVVNPPLPNIKADITPLPVTAITPVKLEEITAQKVSTVQPSPLPELVLDLPLPLAALNKIAIPHPPLGKIDTFTMPPFDEVGLSLAVMHLSDEGYSLLEKLEGFSPELYTLGDGGYTIGFGFFIPGTETAKWRKGISEAEAERLIRQKVPAYEDQVKQYINVRLTQEEFDALTMLAYNLGGFSKASSIVNDINNRESPEKLRRDWMRFVHSKAPRVMKGLMNRRSDELGVRNESNYQEDRKLLIYKSK